ncbi:protein myomaker isoform X1 [Oncorhynchus clarkii lewisi]|uniref:protein myomaker isoform X1 n=1 Tax=Oncorhynchus clarkii lewisi TaxID=490388 RepID=UPI0039B9AFE0
MGAYIAKMLLPTVSSLVFLPAASVATKRGFHMEAMVYFFTMFFTTIYHACDGPGLSIICFMKYEILEYFSVYGTAISIWVTLIALGDFDEPKRSTLTMFGVLTCAVRIYQDRWGYGIYSGPIGSAVFIITVKWLQKMKETRGLYPEKRVYTQQVGPGCCFGALALMLRFYFEEWDYAYVHSFYHLSMAVSFVLLLPKKNRYAGTDGNPAKLSCYTLLCCTPFPASTKEKKDKKKTPSRTIWTIPTERPWTRACNSPTLPLYNPPSTPVKKALDITTSVKKGWEIINTTPVKKGWEIINTTPVKKALDINTTPDKKALDINTTPDKKALDINTTPVKKALDINTTPDKKALDINTTPDKKALDFTTPVKKGWEIISTTPVKKGLDNSTKTVKRALDFSSTKPVEKGLDIRLDISSTKPVHKGLDISKLKEQNGWK